MIPDNYQRKTLPGFLRFLASPVPWQHLYRQTLGKKHSIHPPAHWSLLSSVTENFDPLTFSPQEMTPLAAPDGSTWADPFVWQSDEKNYLFMEDWPTATPSGHLAVMELDQNGAQLHAPTPIISSGTHYSYPQIFKYDGQMWMLPENSASGRLQLYRCVEFPVRWIPDKILMEGIRYADPTLFEYEGRWWLFMTLGVGFYGVNTNLFLFSADSPLASEWIPHPKNPVVNGFHQSRPAGRIFSSQGRLYRPSQDCFKRYGNGLRIHEIIHLDAAHYEERCVRRIYPWKDDILGIHHLDICGNLVMTDVHLKSTTHQSSVR